MSYKDKIHRFQISISESISLQQKYINDIAKVIADLKHEAQKIPDLENLDYLDKFENELRAIVDSVPNVFLLGDMGVGKSTLLNALLDTQELFPGSSSGKSTTGSPILLPTAFAVYLHSLSTIFNFCCAHFVSKGTIVEVEYRTENMGTETQEKQVTHYQMEVHFISEGDWQHAVQNFLDKRV